MSASPRRPSAPWSFLIGAGAAVVGLLPWVVAGMRLPLQNLQRASIPVHGMPVALLPFSQYELIAMAGMLVTGAALGGGLARILRARTGRGGALWVGAGVLAVQAVAVVQTSVVVRGVLQPTTEAALYFTAILGAIVLAVLLGVLVLWLIARAPRPGATVGLAIAALAAGEWLGQLIIPPLTIVPSPLQLWAAGVTRWLPPIVVGVAIAWCGLRTVGRACAAVASLAILWAGPAAITGVSAGAGMRVYARHPEQLIAVAGEVFATALWIPSLTLLPVLLAAAVAAAGLVARRSAGVIRGAVAASPSR